MRKRKTITTHTTRGFRSGLEAKIWDQAKRDTRRRTKVTLDYESERLSYVLVKKYTPDIVIETARGKKIYVEIKGYLRPEDRTKMIAVKQFDPSLDIRFVFAQDNKLNKKSKMKYSDWCNKHNFRYAIGAIPKDWYN